ncbi:BnaC09g14110D [Brassica napus]|uniref:BnaC09g14110D protein n=1 Tax=Brassica napus TaxID=3708 RepID=A0A078ICN7_BRANA|nr:BnaC09g14110D [Brassica napus]
MTHGYGSGQYELRGFNAARELLHLRFSGCRRWGLDKRKGMSSFSGMVSEMASLPSDGASDLPAVFQEGGTCDTCTDAWLERFDNEFNLVLDAHPTG